MLEVLEMCSSSGKTDMKIESAIECLCILNILVGLMCHVILLTYSSMNIVIRHNVTN